MATNSLDDTIKVLLIIILTIIALSMACGYLSSCLQVLPGVNFRG